MKSSSVLLRTPGGVFRRGLPTPQLASRVEMATMVAGNDVHLGNIG